MNKIIKKNSIGILVRNLSFLFLCFFLNNQCTVVDKNTNHSDLDQLIKAANEMVSFNGSVLVGNSEDVYYYQQIGFADKEKNIPLNENHLSFC